MEVNSLFNYSGETDTCSKVQSIEEIVASVLNVDGELITRKDANLTYKILHNFGCSLKG